NDVWVARKRRVHNLDGHAAARERIDGLIDGPHSTRAEHTKQLVLACQKSFDQTLRREQLSRLCTRLRRHQSFGSSRNQAATGVAFRGVPANGLARFVVEPAAHKVEYRILFDAAQRSATLSHPREPPSLPNSG